MRRTLQLLKIGAYISLLLFVIIVLMAIPSLLLKPLTLKVTNKFTTSDHSYAIEGTIDTGGKVVAGYSERFYNKAQLGDTIKFNLSYRILVKNGRIKWIYVPAIAWRMLLLLVSALLPLLLFVPGSALLNSRYFYLLAGVCELVNIFVLGTFLIPFPTPRPRVSQVAAARSEISLLSEAIEVFKADTKRYPTTSEGLTALFTNPGIEQWHGPYITRKQHKLIIDPWGRPFLYRSPGKHGEFDIYSYGKDGQPGGTGDDRDITTWGLQP